MMALVSEEVIFDCSQRCYQCGVEHIKKGFPVSATAVVYTTESGNEPSEVTILSDYEPISALATLIHEKNAAAFVYVCNGFVGTGEEPGSGEAVFVIVAHPGLVHVQHTIFEGLGPGAVFKDTVVWANPARVLGGMEQVLISMGISPGLGARH